MEFNEPLPVRQGRGRPVGARGSRDKVNISTRPDPSAFENALDKLKLPGSQMLPRLFKNAVMIILNAKSQCQIFNNLALQVSFSFYSTRLFQLSSSLASL